ncbi:unnamed protein product [Adineta steineri]|uniref:Ankyrin repeat protein n=1 Tax=Adineta steineri TaxID=433720 RepID=A0A814MZK5_9BILA|nr:unnamed protein product [Adineta steineri]
MSDPTSLLREIIKKRPGEENSYAEIQQLIRRGADIRGSMSDGKSMIESVMEEETQMQKTSLKAKNCRRVIELLQQTASELLSEMVLSGSGDINRMKRLVTLRADCQQEQKYGSLGLLGELLSQSAHDIRLDVVQFLVETDKDAKFVLTKEDDRQQTCLSLSKNNQRSTIDVTNYLQQQLDMLLNRIPFTHPQIDVNEVVSWIRLGANPKTTDELGNTVFLNAVLSSNVDLVPVLIANGSDISHKNTSDKTPLQMAEEMIPRNARLIATLFEQSVNNELKELIRSNRSRLKIQDVYSLLQKGANINARISNNNSFLHYLITHDGTPEMLTAFVNEFNADLLARNNQKRRPIELYIEDEKRSPNVFRTFLKLEKVSTNVFFNDITQQTLYDFANERNKREYADLIEKELNRRLWIYAIHASTTDDQNKNLRNGIKKLVDYGAQINHLNNDNDLYKGWSVLHFACKTTTKSFVEHLIRDLKANCELKNVNDDRPISIAAEYGQIEIVQFLREYADVKLNVFNKNADTPLHLAAKKCHYRIVRYLVLWGADEAAQNLSKQTPLILAQKSETTTKQGEIEKKKTVEFLNELVFSRVDGNEEESITRNPPTFDTETCELIKHINLVEKRRSAQESRRENGNERSSFLKRDPNNDLFTAARNGNVSLARQALDDGADIRHRQNEKSPYKVAIKSNEEYTTKSNLESMNNNDRWKFRTMAQGCQRIADDLFQLAQTQLTESIEQADFSLMMAYHDTEIPITPELLYLACTSSDNVLIVDYLVQNNDNVYEAMYNYTTADSPYQLAKKKQFHNVASYIKYQLSLDCTEAIKENDLELVKQLIRAGANVDLIDTNNLFAALHHENIELIKILCENGAKISDEWLESDHLALKNDIKKQMKPDVALIISRNLTDRNLRLAAASGDFKLLTKCQRLGADIKSKNCHGSTALLCAIQHGNYFRIVFSLVSRGATLLHCNENQPISLIEMCHQKNYKKIGKYLKKQLNKQFATAIFDNDKESAAAFEGLGADFNCIDIQERTPLHYAVEYHTKDLVSWLCERGSDPMIHDGNGDYPITLAAEKGDFAIVEFLATKYPATKQKKNRAGATALHIAQKQGFKRIAQVLQLNEASDNSKSIDLKITTIPKHSRQVLVGACENGRAKIIQEFCIECYESREEKRQLCCELIEIAKTCNQGEIVDILQIHHDQNLKKDIPSNIQFDKIVMLNDEYKAILHGLLVGLNTVITGMFANLDPADPNTYVDLFSNLNLNVQKQSQELVNANTDDEIRKLIQKDLNYSNEKLTKIEKQLNELQKNNQMLNQKKQKKEFYNISVLGNFEELQCAASDTAALLTLYYKQQIESIDTQTRITGSNIFNDQVYWIKEVFLNVRPESDTEKAVVIVAEYITACLLDALKTGGHKDIISTVPLSEQLWLCAAKYNPKEQRIADTVGFTAGKLLIPITIAASKTRTYEVQLRHFIRYVSLITNEGAIYQYPVSPKDLQDNKYPDLNIFGYVYLAPFTPDKKVADIIIEERHLVPAKHNARGDILTKFKDIIDLKNVIQVENIGTKSAAKSQTAFEVAQMLRDQKTFVHSDHLHAELEKSRIEIENEIAILKADITENIKIYQTSIDADNERIRLELSQTQKMLVEQNERQFNVALNELNGQMQEIVKQLESFGKRTIEKMQKQLEASNNHQIDQTQKQLEFYSKKQTLDIQKQLVSENKLQVQETQKQLQSYTKLQIEQTQKQLEVYSKNQILETQKQLESHSKLHMKKYQKQLAQQNKREMKEITNHIEAGLHGAKITRGRRGSTLLTTSF